MIGLMIQFPDCPAALPKLCETSKSISIVVVLSSTIVSAFPGSCTFNPDEPQLGVSNCPSGVVPAGSPAYVVEVA